MMKTMMVRISEMGDESKRRTSSIGDLGPLVPRCEEFGCGCSVLTSQWPQ